MADRVTHSLVSALRAVPSLAALQDRTLLSIVGDSANLFWSAGSEVFARGSAADGLYIVVSGAVRVLDDRGTEVTVLCPGDFFGELSLLDGSPHGHTVVAVEDTELMVIAKECFDDLLAADAELARTIRRTADERRAATATAAASTLL
jgi:CRP-like cAMP-binding protein